MKKSKLAAAILGSALSFSSLAACGNDGKEEPEAGVKVTLSPESLQAGAGAQTLDLTVTVNAAWSVKTYDEWLKVSPAGGPANTATTVRVSLTANTAMEERSGKIHIIAGGATVREVSVTQLPESKATPSLTEIAFGAPASTAELTVSANAAWELTTADEWLAVTPDKGSAGDTRVTVAAKANGTEATRSGSITLRCGDKTTEIKVTQLDETVVTPEGYTLVWSDEFNEGTVPGPDWVHEDWAAGYVNHELQTYTSGTVDGRRTTEIKDGLLHINCFKGRDGKIYSGRINARPATGWLYGYFEARICLPAGKGTWPAFWMMPCNVDWGTNPWPKCGEIDIMEEVGADPDQVSSSLHTQNYNHTKGTQKTHAITCPGAEGGFHTYAVEWTEDEITTYVDGKVQLRCRKAEMGSDHDSWPFHYAFYPILNLAWGGDWGGYKGVDEEALPLTMKVDYVRVFRRN